MCYNMNYEMILNFTSPNLIIIIELGIVAIGKAGAEYLYNRSWKGVEQRLGKDAVHSAEVGRCGLPSSYENEPVSVEKNKE